MNTSTHLTEPQGKLEKNRQHKTPSLTNGVGEQRYSLNLQVARVFLQLYGEPHEYLNPPHRTARKIRKTAERSTYRRV